MILFQLFLSFFQIGLFSFGGGYAILPMIEQQIAGVHGWMTMGEVADALTIGGMMPGSIALNTAVFTGTRIGGLPGALSAAIGCVLPSSIIVLILAIYFFKNSEMRFIQNALNGIRPAVVAMIAVAAVNLSKRALFDNSALPLIHYYSITNINLFALAVLLAALLLLIKKKLGVITAIIGTGAVGLAFYLIVGIFAG